MIELAAAVDTAHTLPEVVATLASQVLEYFIALAAVGSVAMGLIEAFKKLFDVRASFHARRTTRFVEGFVTSCKEQAFSDLLQLSVGATKEDARAAAADLLAHRRIRGVFSAWNPKPAHALFALDIDRMSSVMNEVADTAINAPRKFDALFQALCQGAAEGDVQAWRVSFPTPAATSATAHDPILDTESGKEVVPGTSPRDARELAQIVARLRQAAHQKISGFQLYTEQRWASWNQLAAMVLGSLLLYAVLAINSELPASSLVPLSLLGGLLAPVAKDLVNVLQSAAARTRNTDGE